MAESIDIGGIETTCDSILGGRIRVFQPKKGYRFSLDAILLAKFAAVRRHYRVLELGAGCGVISLILCANCRPAEAVAIEIQPELAELARRNSALNGPKRLRVIEADLRAQSIPGILPGAFDLVIANPPYHASNAGRLSPHRGRMIARSESSASLDDFLSSAIKYLKPRGRLAVIFSADRIAELVSRMRQRRLEPKRLRFVHPYRAAPATLALVEARKGGGVELAVEPPLIIHDSPGSYAAEARELLGV